MILSLLVILDHAIGTYSGPCGRPIHVPHETLVDTPRAVLGSCPARARAPRRHRRLLARAGFSRPARRQGCVLKDVVKTMSPGPENLRGALTRDDLHLPVGTLHDSN